MFLIGLGALLVLGGILVDGARRYLAGTLSGPETSPAGSRQLWSHRAPAACDSWGSKTNWPGILLMAIGAILLASGIRF